MKHKNDLIIDRQALELCGLDPGGKLTDLIGKNTLVVLPERMTALEAVNTVAVLTDITTELIENLLTACGSCVEQKEKEEGYCPFSDGCDPDECPYEGVDEPEVELSDAARRAMGIPLDAKLSYFVDEGELVVSAADHNYDLTDVPEGIRPLLGMAGICAGKLDELIRNEEEIWHG